MFKITQMSSASESYYLSLVYFFRRKKRKKRRRRGKPGPGRGGSPGDGFGAGGQDMMSGSAEPYNIKMPGEPPGKWGGTGAAALELVGIIDEDQYRRVFKGLHPKTGQPLVRNAGKPNRIAGFEGCFSAPKSVSVLFSQMLPEDRERLQELHWRSVEATIRFIEEHFAFSRAGKASEGCRFVPVGLVLSMFEHASARPTPNNLPDPNLHIHVQFLNLGVDEFGAVRSLDSRAIFLQQDCIKVFYWADLAARLKAEFGLQVSVTEDGIRVHGVPQELINAYSKRRQQILDYVAEHEKSGNVNKTHAAKATRSRKDAMISRKELFDHWRQVNIAAGFDDKYVARLLRHRRRRSDTHQPESQPIASNIPAAATSEGTAAQPAQPSKTAPTSTSQPAEIGPAGQPETAENSPALAAVPLETPRPNTGQQASSAAGINSGVVQPAAASPSELGPDSFAQPTTAEAHGGVHGAEVNAQPASPRDTGPTDAPRQASPEPATGNNASEGINQPLSPWHASSGNAPQQAQQPDMQQGGIRGSAGQSSSGSAGQPSPGSTGRSSPVYSVGPGRILLPSKWKDSDKTLATAKRKTVRQVRKIIREAVRGLTFVKNHFSLSELVFAALRILPEWSIDPAIVWDLVAEHLKNDPNIVPLGHSGRYATKQILKDEKRMLAAMERMAKRPGLRVPNWILNRKLAKDPSLRKDQADYVRHLLQHKSVVRFGLGWAGTGKTRALKVVVRACKAACIRVVGVAPTGQAARNLSEAIGIECQTMTKFLGDYRIPFFAALFYHLRQLWRAFRGRRTWPIHKPKPAKVTRRTLVLVDESGMVGTPHARKLAEHVQRRHGTLAMVGDWAQLPAVVSTPPLQALVRRYGAAYLTEICRQEEPWARKASEAFAEGRARQALAMYAARNLVTVRDDIDEVIRDACLMWTAEGLLTPQRAVLIANTNELVHKANLICQEHRLAAGVLKRSPSIRIVDDQDDKVWESRVHVGDRVLFTRNSLSRKGNGVVNGSTGTVMAISTFTPEISVMLDNKQTVRINVAKYRNLRLGYAATTWKLQSSTVPRVYAILAGDVLNLPIAYVQATRAVKDTWFFTTKDLVEPDLSNLANSRLVKKISRRPDLTLASELLADAPLDLRPHKPRIRPDRQKKVTKSKPRNRPTPNVKPSLDPRQTPPSPPPSDAPQQAQPSRHSLKTDQGITPTRSDPPAAQRQREQQLRRKPEEDERREREARQRIRETVAQRAQETYIRRLREQQEARQQTEQEGDAVNAEPQREAKPAAASTGHDPIEQRRGDQQPSQQTGQTIAQRVYEEYARRLRQQQESCERAAHEADALHREAERQARQAAARAWDDQQERLRHEREEEQRRRDAAYQEQAHRQQEAWQARQDDLSREREEEQTRRNAEYQHQQQVRRQQEAEQQRLAAIAWQQRQDEDRRRRDEQARRELDEQSRRYGQERVRYDQDCRPLDTISKEELHFLMLIHNPAMLAAHLGMSSSFPTTGGVCPRCGRVHS